MQLTISKKDLLALVSRCHGVADPKSAMPLLSCLMLVAQGQTLAVSATNTFMSLRDSIELEADFIETAGSVLVSAAELGERAKAMPDGLISLTADSRAQTITLKAHKANRRFTLHTHPADDAPAIPTASRETPALTVPTSVLLELIRNTQHAMCLDETRLNISGTLFEQSASTLRLTATDGHRLARAEAPLESETPLTALIPVAAIRKLRKLLEGVDSVEIRLVRETVFFTFGAVEFSFRVHDAKSFPNCDAVIPKIKKTVDVPRAALADSVSAVCLASEHQGVKLTLGGGTLKLEGSGSNKGTGFDEIPVKFGGADKTTAVNYKYLLDFLGALDSEQIALGLSGELDPITVTRSDDAGSFVGVIMPMRV